MTPTNTKTFEKRSIMQTTMEQMQAFHTDPKALAILTPPPIFIRLHRDTRTSNTEGELEFTLWFGPIPLRWHVRHEDGPIETSFADRMLKGPMGYWRHEHIFEQVDEGIALTDKITLAHPPGIKGLLTRLIFDGIPLRILFFYRHLRTKRAVETP